MSIYASSKQITPVDKEKRIFVSSYIVCKAAVVGRAGRHMFRDYISCIGAQVRDAAAVVRPAAGAGLRAARRRRRGRRAVLRLCASRSDQLRRAGRPGGGGHGALRPPGHPGRLVDRPRDGGHAHRQRRWVHSATTRKCHQYPPLRT